MTWTRGVPQGSGTGGKADYGERGGGNGAVEEGKSDGMGAESKWDKGDGGIGSFKSTDLDGYIKL